MITPVCIGFSDKTECPYASGHEDCTGCKKYQEDTRPHPLDDSGQADYDRDMDIETKSKGEIK